MTPLYSPPMKTAAFCLLASCTALLAGPQTTTGKDSPAPDKSHYTLFSPTPAEQMREFSPDRPDQTEGPFTVDAGHVQLEMDFVNYTYDRHSPDGTHSEVWNVAPLNIRIGLLNNVEADVIFDNYVNVRQPSHASGFGDITTRLKINFWGNDGGSTALGLIPFVKLPLDASNIRNGHTEGGIILPLDVQLPGGWDMGAMTEVDWVSNDDGGHDQEWVNSVSFSHGITGKLSGYVEFFSVVGNAPGFDWVGQVDAGLTCGITENIQVDLGCNFGVTKSAPDVQPFAGLSIRF